MRLTRAAMRAQGQSEEIEIHEDADKSMQEPQPQEGEDVRPALKDITDANLPSTTDEYATKQILPTKAKGRKRDKAMEEQTTQDDATIEQGTHQEELIQMEGQETPADNDTPEIGEVTMQTPQKQLAPPTKTPKFDPEVHVLSQSPSTEEAAAKDDSFVDSIKSRSPSKLRRDSAEPDSFVEEIKTRTPARRISRIEDSVEAMDALEDAIEEISGSLPKLDQDVESPIKARKQSPLQPAVSPTRRQSRAKATTPAVRKTALGSTTATKTPKSAKISLTKTQTAQLKSAPPRTASGRVSVVKLTTAPAITKSTNLHAGGSTGSTAGTPAIQNGGGYPQSPVVGRTPSNSERQPQPQMSFSTSPLKKQPDMAKKRVTSSLLSTSKPAFVPAKSSKPPTTSNFSLPSEAIAAKFKAQREERTRKEEEEKAKPTFKARPVPPKVSRPSLVPRENKASQVRTSAIRSGSNKENVAPRQVPSTIGKPSTILNVNKTRPDLNKANSAVRRTTIPPKTTTRAPRASLAPRITSLSAGERLAVTKDEAVQQKIKGKEVFGRARADKEAADKEKREKEEAAKKARAAAAERGRQASREWAEKQRRKLEMQKATKAATENAPVPVAAPSVTASS